MDHFSYRNGLLYAEDVPLPKLAMEVGTPFYCYSTATLERHYTIFAKAFESVPATICFAVKANSNLAVLKTLANLGSGADTVSEGEIRRARAVGISASKIVFSGVGKTRDEIRYALGAEIGQFNVESPEEMEVLAEVAAELGIRAKVAIRINPDVDAETHDKISTGRKTDKFGVAFSEARDVYNRAKAFSHIEIVGVSTHIGSQLTNLKPFKEAFERIRSLVEDLREDGHEIKRLDLGGGLGIPYASEDTPDPEEYAAMIIDTVKHLGCELILEPGRLIAGNAGILVSKVVLVKNTNEKTFVILDAAMNDLIRPSLYEAWHDVIPIIESTDSCNYKPVDIVGPICETTDVLARDRRLPPLAIDDLIAFRSAGAYGATLSSTYNSRLLVPEVMVNGEDYQIIRPRQNYADLLEQDVVPDWL